MTLKVSICWDCRTFFHILKKSHPCTGQILSTCAVLQDASAPALFEHVRSGTRIKENQKVTRKRTRQVEVFYGNLKCGVRLKADKIRQKFPEKMNQ